MALSDDIAITIIYSLATLQRWSGAKRGGASCDYRRHYLGGGERLDKNVTHTHGGHTCLSHSNLRLLCGCGCAVTGSRVSGHDQVTPGGWVLSAGAGVSYAGRPGQLGSSGKWPGYGARLFMSTQTTQAEGRHEESLLFARLWWIMKITVQYM